jgi:hypothetical protein
MINKRYILDLNEKVIHTLDTAGLHGFCCVVGESRQTLAQKTR